jgi:hypothetical protein
MDSRKKNQQSGFTILEVVITILFFMLLIMAGTAAIGPWVTWKQRYDTLAKLEVLKKGVEIAYRTSAWQIDNDENPKLLNNTTAHELSSALPTGMVCPTSMDDLSSNTGWQYLFSYLGTDKANALTDGYNNPLCIIISPRLKKTVDNSVIYYRVFSFISKGANREIDNAGYAADPVTGMIQAVSGDDMMVYVTGQDIQTSNYESIKKKIEKVSSAYQEYFHSRFLMNVSQNVYLDYFYSTDAGEIQETSTPTTANFNGFAQNLHLTDSDISLPWQSSALATVPSLLEFSNAMSGFDRFPTSGDANMKTPPWSAHIGGRLPGNNDAGAPNYVLRTVEGVY